MLKKDISEKRWLWYKSYFPGSVGGAPFEIVKQYIKQKNTPD